jgi:hypothetical protein
VRELPAIFDPKNSKKKIRQRKTRPKKRQEAVVVSNG